MAPRTSSRNASNRRQASSPPKQARNGQSQSPISRRTRSTRSASVEQRDSHPPQRGRARGRPRPVARHENEDGVEESAPVVARRSGKAPAAREPRELSVVAENRELESLDDEEDGDPVELSQAERSRSLGSMSEMSGTTAITTASAVTSHSVSEIKQLDPDLVEKLPDLYNISRQILGLLAPDDISQNKIEVIIRDLKLPGSQIARRHRYQEDMFQVARNFFGTDGYIKTSFILRKLLNGEEPGEGDFRPDAVIYTANIATLVKTFLVVEQESQKSRNLLMNLDMRFPGSFVRKYDATAMYGDSALVGDSFKFALEIRTQFTIVSLKSSKDDDDWNPEEILSRIFYEPDQPNSPFSSFEDSVREWQLKNILAPIIPLSARQINRVYARAEAIKATFREDPEAIQNGDQVDFDRLEELFPWLNFASTLVKWSRLRLTELSKAIDKQGGVQNLTDTLISAMKDLDSQLDMSLHALPSVKQKRKSSPVALARPAAPGAQSLYNKSTIPFVETLTKKMVKIDAHDPQKQKSASMGRSRPNQTRGFDEAPTRSAPDRLQQPTEEDEISDVEGSVQSGHDQASTYQTLEDVDGEDEGLAPAASRPNDEYNRHLENYLAEKNKENLPQTKKTAKKSMLDHQPGARKVLWSDEREDESEDEGFQDDQRIPDPNRRAQGDRPPKRAREPPLENDASDESQTQVNHKRQKRHRQPSTIPHRNDPVEHDWDDNDIQYTQVAAIAKAATQKAISASYVPQRRKKWTENDEHYLKENIIKHGTRWALISQLDGWEDEHDQVALKDKARNMKVGYIKARIPLPMNFENIRLGKKEVTTIQRVIPDFEYD